MRSIRRRALVLAVAAIGVVAIGGSALAAQLAGEVKTFTGCLSSGDGVIVKVKEGDSPKSPCSSGQTLARISGGDITKVSVTGALTGGGDNGDITIGLKPEFSLPQGCSTGRVAKWNGSAWVCGVDNDTTYAAGAGLNLDITESPDEFSIEPGYRLPGKACATAGQFTRGFDSSGNIQCATPSATVLQAFQDGSPVGRGIPDSGDDTPVASISPPAGTYLVIAKGELDTDGNVTVSSGVSCRLGLDRLNWTSQELDDFDEGGPFALTELVTTTGEPIALTCNADVGADGIAVNRPNLVALKIS